MNSRISAFLLGLSFAAVYVLGCATARYIEPRASAQTAPAGVQRWEYECFEQWGDHGRSVARELNVRGQQGWELVAAAHKPEPDAKPTWCMRRPL